MQKNRRLKLKREQNKAYKVLVQEIAEVVQQSRVFAVHAIQQTSNLLYWEIGKIIIEWQNQYGWGAAIVDNLSIDLQAKIGAGQSWSARNLRLMRQLYEEYSQYTFTETRYTGHSASEAADFTSAPVI